mmetsp:Transcript_14425/g.20449  ORF Transcript_14425/g.20449 Transcript_14425/m.20449 type:complete len:516 (+) Transcript_14425:71-1618(+)
MKLHANTCNLYIITMRVFITCMIVTMTSAFMLKSQCRMLISDSNRGQLNVENVVIIGSGPAGYTAAIYAARANLKPLLFEGIKLGPPGGQLMTTTEVENFPGFHEGITGPQLMENMRKQAVRWGAECEPEDVESVDFSSRPYVIKGTSREVKSSTVIIATGATARKLNLPSENDFWSRGISACAICDGAAPIFQNQILGVVGGGDSAVEEAIFLTKYGSSVHLFVRSHRLKASKVMQNRIMNHPRIEIHLNTSIEDVYGNKEGTTTMPGSPMTGARIKNTKTKEIKDLPIRGLFYAIGHTPNTELFKGSIDLDAAGYIKTQPGLPNTNIDGIYAAGDVQDHEWRQAVTAAGSGCSAALSAERYLAMNGLINEIVPAKTDLIASNDDESEGKQLEEDTSQTFDINLTMHSGEYALRRLYHESSRPVVVKYISPNCGPCKALGSILKKVLSEFEKEIHFVEVDITLNPTIADSAGIMGTPTVQIFKDKALLHTIRGVNPKSEYRKHIDQSILAKVES